LDVNNGKIASDAAIREMGLKVLYKHLGETDAVLFFAGVHGKKDYLKSRR